MGHQVISITQDGVNAAWLLIDSVQPDLNSLNPKTHDD
jgi:hypothetical protein